MLSSPVATRLQTELATLGGRVSLSHGLVVCEIEPPQLLTVVEQLKTQFGFDVFLDVTAVDWPDRAPRFEVVHHFYSSANKLRVRIKCRVSEASPVVATLRPLYGSAGYMERECHEMYGIQFDGNDDLRAILLYEGFKGHPLRKDYPKQLEQPLVPFRF